jgi:ubiquinone biosynthesis protein
VFRSLNISLLILWLCHLSLAEIHLPTAREHYQKFKPGTSGLVLLSTLAQELDPSTQQMLLNFFRAVGLPMGPSIPEIDPATQERLLKAIEAQGLPSTPPIPKQQALAFLKQVNWAPLRPQLLEFLIHQSQVLEMIPQQWGDICIPITHDGLLYFLDHLPEDRLLDKIVNLAYLPPGSPRGEYLLEFVAKTPSLQKLGQILARNPDLSPDYRQALQQLENGIRTMTRDELVQFIREDVGEGLIEKYQVKFGDQILAEASVGAVIRATFVPPGASAQREAICKVVKPYVLTYLPQDLSIIDGLADYFARQHEFYELGPIPLAEMFREIKRSLTDEIKTVEEQHNLSRAREYYRGNEKILVPELFPLSNEHVTMMEFVHGEKIAAAFPGDAKKRAVMARRFSDALTFDVIFSPKEESLFHGDPHAGNVFHVADDPKDPYRLALLDWGVCGTFPRKERMELVQLMLGVQLRDAKRLRNNVDALLEHGLPKSPEQLRRIDAVISQVLTPKPSRSSFDALGDLLMGLIEEGHATKFNLNLFIKSQITIAGILAELDPTLDQDKYLRQRVAGLVKKEFPKRILQTLWFPAWNSRSYRSMLSNQDVFDELFKKPKAVGEAKGPATQPAALKAETP